MLKRKDHAGLRLWSVIADWLASRSVSSRSYGDVMTPLPDLIRRAGLTPVTIIKNLGTDDEERAQVEAQLLNSGEAYFALEDPLFEGDHVEMPDPRGGLVVKQAARVTQHPMPANMARSFAGRVDTRRSSGGRKRLLGKRLSVD